MVWMGKYGFYDFDDVILRLSTLTTAKMTDHTIDSLALTQNKTSLLTESITHFYADEMICKTGIFRDYINVYNNKKMDLSC